MVGTRRQRKLYTSTVIISTIMQYNFSPLCSAQGLQQIKMHQVKTVINVKWLATKGPI